METRKVEKMREKRVFMYVFLGLSIILMLLPFMVTFNEILTKLAENFGLYRLLQETVVPRQVQMVALMLKPLGIVAAATPEGLIVNEAYAKISWNCLGWQSLLLLIVTFVIGLSGDYTFLSRAEAILIGLLGTFLLNLLRISLTVILLFVSRSLFAVVFHDYLAAFMTIVWLFFFWWFSYSFVLEEKNAV